MDVTEILQFVDSLVYEHTGKHLNDVQRAVVEGAYQRKTYSEIGENNNFHTNHLSDVGGNLWKLLSEILDEDVKKKNFRSTLDRVYINSSQNPNICGNNNFVLQTTNKANQQDKQTKINTKSQSIIYHNLTLAPQIIKFYDRETELKTLNDSTFKQNISLISVLGLSGIGKTYLVKRFVDLNLEKFEVIIWKTLQFPKSLDLLINDLLNVCEVEVKEILDDKLKQLFAIFTNQKCLIILDDVENIFIRGEFAGEYQTQFQDYQNFFTMINQTEHQSKIILISQEECKEMRCFDEDLSVINCLKLQGLDNIEILKNMGFEDDSNLLKLLNLYDGNPFYLQDISYLIKNLFNSKVADFLAEDELIITQNITNKCQNLLNKLSTIEQEILLKISESEQPLSRQELSINLELSSLDLINGLQSLQQRCLLQKIEGENVVFVLAYIFKKYLRMKKTNRTSI